MAYTPRLLSGSTNGRPIKVAQTATAGTLIHTAVTGTSDIDTITLDACNTSAGAVLLTIEWGGVSAPDDTMEVSLPADSGWVRVVSGLRLQNSLVVRAFAASANVIIINGFVNRYAV